MKIRIIRYIGIFLFTISLFSSGFLSGFIYRSDSSEVPSEIRIAENTDKISSNPTAADNPVLPRQTPLMAENRPDIPLEEREAQSAEILEKEPRNPEVNCDRFLLSENTVQIETENFSDDLDAFLHPENHEPLEIVTAIRRMDGYISAHGHRVLEKLIREHENPDVRMAALQVISDRSYSDVLIYASKDENPAVRENAVARMADFEEDTDGMLFGERMEEIAESENDEGILLTALQYCERFSSTADEFLSMTHILLQRDDLPGSFLFTYLDKLTDYEISPGFAEALFTYPVTRQISDDEREYIKEKCKKNMVVQTSEE